MRLSFDDLLYSVMLSNQGILLLDIQQDCNKDPLDIYLKKCPRAQDVNRTFEESGRTTSNGRWQSESLHYQSVQQEQCGSILSMTDMAKYGDEKVVFWILVNLME